jgi:hypothetical protein
MRLAQQMQMQSTATGATGSNSGMIPAAAGQAMSSLGLASGYLAGERGTAGSDNVSQDEAIESRPQLLTTSNFPKSQRLKGTTKVAKVVLVDEVPFVRQPRSQSPNAATVASGDNP